MILVKLNAINSTNTYLKQLAKKLDTISWTVVTAEFQTLGRGQLHNKWVSDKGKNLICSILIRFYDLKIKNQFYLNCAVSLGIYDALNNYNLPQLKIKWPNDIMSVSKKMGGILIENSLKKDYIHQSVVGIGLNINQVTFPSTLVNAISMKQILDVEVDRDQLLTRIVASIKTQIEILNNNGFNLLHANYEKSLFKKDEAQMFEDHQHHKFMGKILGITKSGMLIVAHENQMIKEYNFKEIKFL